MTDSRITNTETIGGAQQAYVNIPTDPELVRCSMMPASISS